jgi:peptide/nickel transport system permease protein
MIAFVLRRVMQSFGVMAAVSFIAFMATAYIGDPLTGLLGAEATPTERAELRQRLGLDDPMPVRFSRFAVRAVRGDFGVSYRQAEPVLPMILSRFSATAELAVVAMLAAVLVGVPLGIYTGLYPASLPSRLLMTVSLVGVSLPTFLVGILLILLFSVFLGWLPSFGRGDTVDVGVWSTGLLTLSGVKALILPAATLGMFQMTLILRLVRSEVVQVLQTDYVKFARARGLSDRAINFGHVLRNTLLPVITIVGMQFGSMVAFAIITESIFAWPGMGYLFLQSIQSADLPAISAYLVFIGLLFVSINLFVDLLYFVVDPRIRLGRGGRT